MTLTTYEDFIKCHETCQSTSNVALAVHIGYSFVCLYQSSSLGLVSDYSQLIIYLVIVMFSHYIVDANYPFTTTTFSLSLLLLIIIFLSLLMIPKTSL